MSENPQQGQQQQKPAVKPMYKVFDMNQRGKDPRKHDIIVKMYGDDTDPEIQTYALHHDEPVEMEMAHAMKFLCDPAFKVIAPNGNRIMPVERIDVSRPIAHLADDEIVVKFSELSREALFRRVKVMAGSEEIKDSASIAELAGFLVKWRKQLKGMTDGERQLAEIMAKDSMIDGNMSADELAKMFPSAQRKAA